ncbi:MAG: substrate-binding domain-containing protein [bacterium]
MKKILSSLLVISLFIGAAAQPNQVTATEEELKGVITMSGAWALYPLAIKWAEEFQKIHLKVKIDIAAGGAGKGIADALAQVVDIGMVSREIYPAEVQKGAWWVPVAKDAVVPTVNMNNPALKEVLSKGVTREALRDIWIKGHVKDWETIVSAGKQGSRKEDLHVYTRSDACGAADTWAKFLGAKQEDLLGVGVYGDPGLAEAVKKDIFGIGFNNINYVYDAKTKRQVEGIKVLPIDINGSGSIDEDEDFYDSRDEIVGAIAAGKYPSPPARDLYFVSQGKPKSKVVIEFITWVLTDGRNYVSDAGYITISDEKLREALEKLESE